MIKYRVIKKEMIVDGMDKEDALNCMMTFHDLNPKNIYDIEEYNYVINEDKRMGRDPDLH
jgi:hypothetical protein